MADEDKRTRGFSFTLNNYTDEELKVFDDDKFKIQCKYLIYGKEVGEQKTPHLQGFAYFHNAKTFTQIKKWLPRAHLEKSHGTIEQNIAYCSKDGDVHEQGVKPECGKRTDLIKIKSKVLNNEPISDVLEIVQNVQQLNFMEKLMKYQKPPPPKKKTVKWYYGGTGTGKTRRAILEGGDDYYISSRNLQWWDGYIGQKVVIIDDFRKDFCTFHELLRILDRYPYRLQIKGGSVWLQADVIIITSCYEPDQVYDTREDKQQLLRRIDEIRAFKKKKE